MYHLATINFITDRWLIKTSELLGKVCSHTCKGTQTVCAHLPSKDVEPTDEPNESVTHGQCDARSHFPAVDHYCFLVSIKLYLTTELNVHGQSIRVIT